MAGYFLDGRHYLLGHLPVVSVWFFLSDLLTFSVHNFYSQLRHITYRILFLIFKWSQSTTLD